MRRYRLFDLKNIPTPNFLMTALELKDFIDFEVKRIYFITNPSGEYKTGSHCHLKREDELFIQLQGESTIVLDDGHGLEDIKLVGPKQAVYVPVMVWHHFKDMSSDSIVVALSSTNYDPTRSDYCEDYQEFQQLLKQNG